MDEIRVRIRRNRSKQASKQKAKSEKKKKKTWSRRRSSISEGLSMRASAIALIPSGLMSFFSKLRSSRVLLVLRA
jgi:hypothetical protein